jgi:hypothetical protein
MVGRKKGRSNAIQSSDEGDSTKTFEDACVSNLLVQIRGIIVAIRASGHRRDKFNSWIRMGIHHIILPFEVI